MILRPVLDDAYDEIDVFEEYIEPSVDRIEVVRVRSMVASRCGGGGGEGGISNGGAFDEARSARDAGGTSWT